MYAILFGHDQSGKLNRVSYFENVHISPTKISGIHAKSLIYSGTIGQWRDFSSIELRSFQNENLHYAWYDKVYQKSSVLDLIEIAESVPQLTQLCELLYQRV